jgi:hypothetical protein
MAAFDSRRHGRPRRYAAYVRIPLGPGLAGLRGRARQTLTTRGHRSVGIATVLRPVAGQSAGVDGWAETWRRLNASATSPSPTEGRRRAAGEEHRAYAEASPGPVGAGPRHAASQDSLRPVPRLARRTRRGDRHGRERNLEGAHPTGGLPPMRLAAGPGQGRGGRGLATGQPTASIAIRLGNRRKQGPRSAGPGPPRPWPAASIAGIVHPDGPRSPHPDAAPPWSVSR